MTAWGKVPDRGLALARVAASGKACGARREPGMTAPGKGPGSRHALARVAASGKPCGARREPGMTAAGKGPGSRHALARVAASGKPCGARREPGMTAAGKGPGSRPRAGARRRVRETVWCAGADPSGPHPRPRFCTAPSAALRVHTLDRASGPHPRPRFRSAPSTALRVRTHSPSRGDRHPSRPQVGLSAAKPDLHATRVEAPPIERSLRPLVRRERTRSRGGLLHDGLERGVGHGRLTLSAIGC